MEMSKTIFENLRMTIFCDHGEHSLSLSVESGFVGFDVTIPLTEKDAAVIETDIERAAFLQAALHHPFQLKETRPGNEEQRYYLDKILHSPKPEVESFLTEFDHGEANGAISNMVHITCGNDQGILRKGQWFNR
jgi:hypothetical protein